MKKGGTADTAGTATDTDMTTAEWEVSESSNVAGTMGASWKSVDSTSTTTTTSTTITRDSSLPSGYSSSAGLAPYTGGTAEDKGDMSGVAGDSRMSKKAGGSSSSSSSSSRKDSSNKDSSNKDGSKKKKKSKSAQR